MSTKSTKPRTREIWSVTSHRPTCELGCATCAAELIWTSPSSVPFRSVQIDGMRCLFLRCVDKNLNADRMEESSRQRSVWTDCAARQSDYIFELRVLHRQRMPSTTRSCPDHQVHSAQRYHFVLQEAPLTLRELHSRCRNIKGEPHILGSFLAQGHAHFFLWVWFYDEPFKPQLRAKFEVAGIIYYGDIR